MIKQWQRRTDPSSQQRLKRTRRRMPRSRTVRSRHRLNHRFGSGKRSRRKGGRRGAGGARARSTPSSRSRRTAKHYSHRRRPRGKVNRDLLHHCREEEHVKDVEILATIILSEFPWTYIDAFKAANEPVPPWALHAYVHAVLPPPFWHLEEFAPLLDRLVAEVATWPAGSAELGRRPQTSARDSWYGAQPGLDWLWACSHYFNLTLCMGSEFALRAL